MIRAKLQILSWSLSCFLAIAMGPVSADELTVRVLDAGGVPVPDVAVFATREDGRAGLEPTSKTAVMDQVDIRFVPHILLIQKGMSVEFPNSDVVAHHVYSFSKPNNFVLPLYKGEVHEPVAFAHDGVVTIGCNIHDEMLAYIVVVDTNAYAMTDSQGEVQLTTSDPISDYDINIWSPRIKDDKEQLKRRLSDGDLQNVVFTLKKSLWPSQADHTESIEWSDY
jgi:plastocyanin